MESQLVLGFKEATSSEVFGEGNYKLVPWINWDDWNFVRESLFSSSPSSINFGFERISAWRSRGCLPVLIEVTASIVEIQQKDSYFRKGLSESDLLAEDMLTMLYCMTIMRLVNGIVEKTRKKNEVSIGEAAQVIGIPRMLIDIRHECSHRDLPSLRLVRLASTKALDWLKAYYWDPQKLAIPCPSDRTAAKEIKSKIRELAFNLDVKRTTKSSSSVVTEKRIKHYEHLCRSGKFLSLMAVKIQSSKSSGPKKHINKALKNVLKLYSSFPLEFVSILIEFLLKARESTDVARPMSSSQDINSGAYNTQLDDWKPLFVKLSNKEPEMLLSLLKAVLQMIEAREAHKHKSGETLKPEDIPGFHQTEHLSCLFEWLVGNLNNLKPSHRKFAPIASVYSLKKKSLSKSTLVNLLHKCLTVSSLGNSHLATAASVLAQTAGNHTLVQKLNRLASLHTSITNPQDEITSPDSESFFNQQEISINQASNNLEVLKQKLSQRANLKTVGESKNKINKRWSVAKSWKPCPIGMLPSDIGSSGLVPVLDYQELKNIQECNEKLEVNKSCGKREPDFPLGVLDDSDVKKHKKNEHIDEKESFLEGVNNQLMIGGVWKRVTDDELVSIASGVRILV